MQKFLKWFIVYISTIELIRKDQTMYISSYPTNQNQVIKLSLNTASNLLNINKWSLLRELLNNKSFTRYGRNYFYIRTIKFKKT